MFETNHQYPNQGTPAAYFPDTHCNFASHFAPMQIIINLDFCTWRTIFPRGRTTSLIVSAGGDWAGATYSADGCPSTCVGELHKWTFT